MTDDLHLLITGGPGAGATTTGLMLSKALGIPAIDSDRFFHQPTDPPYQQPYPKEERNRLICAELGRHEAWILSGSIAAWEIEEIRFTHAVVLQLGWGVRSTRLALREARQFGPRIAAGGDMHAQHQEFMDWAAHYETGTREGRSLPVERAFLARHCDCVLEIQEAHSLESLVAVIAAFVKTSA